MGDFARFSLWVVYVYITFIFYERRDSFWFRLLSIDWLVLMMELDREKKATKHRKEGELHS